MGDILVKLFVARGLHLLQSWIHVLHLNTALVLLMRPYQGSVYE